MKKKYSFIACCLIFFILCIFRGIYSDMRQGQPPLKVTVWDAFGYYAYLPAVFIYHDCKELKWITAIDAKYAMTGGTGWPTERLGDGSHVLKYLGGVAIMELPFFFAAHGIAHAVGYPPDGFSPPYQYALGFGVICYCFLGLLLLRKVLLLWFGDKVTALTLIMLCLATNFIQYAAIDNGQSHGYIFPLYALMLYATVQWHRRPAMLWASVIGYVIGFAAISRPTEAIVLFIPLLWDMHTKEAAKQKWLQVRENKKQMIAAAAFGLLAVIPQLVYWKYVTGSLVFDVGSKWDFLNPHFRVLFGWEKGWFIYTPVTLLFITGMFFIRAFPFRKSVLWFCLLNIYIIIAWHDWRYGGSYSTRALVQSYPVFALPFAALADKATSSRWRILFYIACSYLLLVNLFQITQYCAGVLHCNDMNRQYYGHIYLNPHPSPIDESLLDDEEIISNELKYSKTVLCQLDTNMHIIFGGSSSADILQKDLHISTKETWLKMETAIYAPNNLWQTYLNADIKNGDTVKHARIRLFSPTSINEGLNEYAFYIQVPTTFQQAHLRLYLTSPFNFNGDVRRLLITQEQR